MAAFDPSTARPEGAGSSTFDPTTATPVPEAPKRGFRGWAGDIAGVALRSAVAVPELAVGILDIPTGGAVGQFLENKEGSIGFKPKQAKEFISDTFDSEATKQQNREFQQADGFVEKAKYAIQNPSMIGRTVGESLGPMGAGGLMARGAMAVGKLGPVAAGAIGEGLASAGSQAEQIRQETEDGRLTPGQSALAAATGAATSVIGGAAGRLQRRMGVGDVDTMLAQGAGGVARQNADDAARAAVNPAAAVNPKSVPRSVIEGAISEGLLEELPQSVAEQLFQNLALDKPWDTDLDGAAVMGVLSGGAMGAGAGGYGAATRPRAAAAPGEQTAAAPAAPGLELAPMGGDVPATGPAVAEGPLAEPSALGDVRTTFDPRSGAQPAPGLLPQADPSGIPYTPEAAAAQEIDTGNLAIGERQTPALGFNPLAGTPTVFPDGSVALNGDQEFEGRTGVNPTTMRPSQAMGLDPAAGPMSSAAALAVDSGATQQIAATEAAAQAAQQQDAAASQAQQEQQAQAKEQAAAEKATADRAQTAEKDARAGQARLNMATGDLLEPKSIGNLTGAQLAETYRAARKPATKRILEQELAKRARKIEQAAQQEVAASPAAAPTLTAEEQAGVASTLAGQELAAQPIPTELAGLQAQLAQVQQRAADNGSWNVPLMAQRRRIEDAIAKLQPATTEGEPRGTQAQQAQQGSPKQTQGRAAQGAEGSAKGQSRPTRAAAGPAPAGAPAPGALNSGAPAANPGAKAAPAPGQKGAAASESPAQRLARVGAEWDAAPASRRTAVGTLLGEALNPVQRKNLGTLTWARMSPALRTQVADLIGAQDANAPAPTESGYQAARQVADAAMERSRAAAKRLDEFDRLPNGLTTDAAKSTPEWKLAKAESDAAMLALQRANASLTKNFPKEHRVALNAERAARAASPAPTPGPSEAPARAAKPKKTIATRRAAEQDDGVDNMAVPAARRDTPENLVVVHNLTAANLLHADELGGLAAPSLAIARVDAPLDGFGEITLVGGPDMAKPSAKNPVFDADVYSPRFPTITVKVNERAVRSALQPLMESAQAQGIAARRPDSAISELERNRLTGAIDQLSYDAGMRLGFAKAVLGKDIQVPMKDVAPRPVASAQGSLVQQSPLVEYLPTVDIQKMTVAESAELAQKVYAALFNRTYANFQQQNPDMNSTALYEKTMGAVNRRINWFAKTTIPEGSTELEFDKVGKMTFDGLTSIARLVNSTPEQAAPAPSQEVDYEALRETLDREAPRPAMDAWLREKLTAAMGERRVVKDNGRTAEYSMENIVREMTRRVRDAEGFNYGLGNARSKGATKFKTLRQIQEQRGRVVPNEQFEAARKEIQAEFDTLAKEVTQYQRYERDSAYELLAEAIGNSYAMPMERALEDATLIGVPVPLRQRIGEFAAALVNAPTEYFEAKPQRAVKFNEFRGAVIPSDTSPEVRAVLEKNGLQVREYEKGKPGDRAAAVSQLAADEAVSFKAAEPARRVGTPTDNAVMGLARAGAEGRNILQAIRASSRTPQNKRLASALLNVGINPKVAFGDSLGGADGLRVIANYNRNTDTITMSELARPEAEQTFLHEAVHAATVQALNRNGVASVRMNRLYEHVKKQGAAADQYGMKNVREFVAEAFTNPEFQAAMEAMPAPPNTSGLRSAWDAFVQLVRDILRLGPSNPNGPNVLEEIMRAGPLLMRENAELTGVGNPDADITLSTDNREVPGETTAKNIGNAIKGLTATNLKQRAGWKADDYMGLGLQLLGRRQLVDVYGEMLPQLKPYSDLMAQMDADKNEAGAGADEVSTEWGKLKDERQLAELMHDATLAQMDPAEPYVSGDDRAEYDRLQARYNFLTPEAKATYAKARDMYSKHQQDVRRAIKERIERSDIGGERKAALLKRMDDEFFERVKGVYFPLARFGNYLVVVKNAEGKTVNVSRAETMAEAQATREMLATPYPAKDGYTVGKVLRAKEFIAERDSVTRGFMEQLYGVLDKQSMDAGQRAELEDSLGQLYLSALPDLSWAKHGIHRKGTPGFSQDARRAFAQNTFHGARYLAKLRYSDLLQDQLNEMDKHVEAYDSVDEYDSVRARQVVDEMNKRHAAAMNPQSNPLSTALTSLGFVFHLGLSPASAMVNLTQTALVAYPVMGAKWGFKESGAALLKASAEAAKNKNDITSSLNADEKAAYDEAVRSGVIDVTMAHDLAGIAQGEDAGVMWKLRPVMKAASWLFHHAEKFNRQVTFVASYRLAKDAGADSKQAYADAVKATYDGHFDYSSNNRARIMQGNVARVVLLFKQYGQNMVYTLARSAQQSLKGATPEQRTQARKALAGLLVMHGLAAGALGLPMVTTLLAAASMIGGDDDEPWDAKVELQNMLADTFGQKTAEVMSHGLSRLTPWDISGRVGLDKLILPDVQEGLEGQRLAEATATAALGPVAGIGINALKGLQSVADGQYLRGLESMMPTVLRSPLKAIRYGEEGVKDKTGIVIQDEVGAAELLGQAAGFSPSSVRNAYEGKSAIVQHDRALQARRSALVEQYAMATMAGDDEGQTEAREAIAKFNEKNPNRRINPLQLAQSIRMREKRIREAEDGVYLPSKRRDALEQGRFAAPEAPV